MIDAQNYLANICTIGVVGQFSVGKNKKVQLKICKSCYTGTTDSELATYVRNIWLLTAIHDIQLVVVHIQGKRMSQQIYCLDGKVVAVIS